MAELAEVFASEPAPDPKAWSADLEAGDDVFGADEPLDPFDRPTR